MKAVRTGGVARAADMEEAADFVVVVLESRVRRDNADGERDKRKGSGEQGRGQEASVAGEQSGEEEPEEEPEEERRGEAVCVATGFVWLGGV